MEVLTTKSFEELYNLISKIKVSYGSDKEIWFRGQGNATYTLMPGLLRSPNWIEKEEWLYDTYKKMANRIGFDEDDEWKTLINMQHYGIPTRLLDWTSNLGIALFFAVTSSIDNYPMSLYVLKPTELNKLSNKTGIPTLPKNTMGLSYIKQYMKKDEFVSPHPIAAKSTWINDRIWAQSGMFTIHSDIINEGIISSTLDINSPIYEIIIEKDAIQSIKHYFQVSNINEFSVYPDIQGLVGFLKESLRD